MKLFFDAPEIWQTLKRKPELIAQAVEEAIRLESPVQKVSRWTAEDVELSGFKIKKGSQVVALIGAANRDPEVFAEPEAIDFQHAPNKHLGFGKGVHHCLGISLARMEARIAFSCLLDMIDGFQVAGFDYRTLSSFRSLSRLDIQLLRQSYSEDY
jgi:cytochrome P450